MKKVKINKKLIALLMAGTISLMNGYTNTTEDGLNSSNIEINENDLAYAEAMEKQEIIDLITKSELNIREEANTDSKIIDIVDEGTHLEGIEEIKDWYKINYYGRDAYVSKKYTYKAIKKEGQKEETSIINRDDLKIQIKNYVEAIENVNIRTDATTDSNIIGQLNQGESLEAISLLNNGWYEVKYKGKSAYIKSDYLKKITHEEILSPFEKIVMFNHDSDLYNKNKEVIDLVDKYQVAYVYKDLEDTYLATVNNNLVYINKEDTESLDEKVVIVDISDQNLKLYNNNEVVVDTPVVTGSPNTPSDLGCFEIYSIDPNRYLGGPGYKVFTDISMFYNGGEALHDAEYHTDYDEEGNEIINHGWRSYDEFGGDTYLYNGSHGCVNLPNNAAMEIYHNVELGTKVIVKK